LTAALNRGKIAPTVAFGTFIPYTLDVPLSLGAYERLAIERALAETGGDAPEAARRLGLGRSTFYRKLAKHGLQPGR
jgi:transcriptional regulator of acetoin/glycerol metabolism